MLKITRIIRTIVELLYKKKYSLSKRIKLLITFLKLELLVLFNSGSGRKEVNCSIAGFRVYGFNYASLLQLFKEIFVTEEYYTDLKYDQPTIIDCGANIGMATIYFKWRYPTAIIDCFEPDINTFQLLKKNVDENKLSGVTMHNMAVTDYNGSITFYSDEKNPGSLRMSVIPERMQKNETTVPCIRLSEFLQSAKPDIAKIDIEGAENTVLIDLDKTGTLINVNEYFIEYHHKIENQKSNMSAFLLYFEKNNFEYHIAGEYKKYGEFQDLLIHARRS